jgi:hypothetical protein
MSAALPTVKPYLKGFYSRVFSQIATTIPAIFDFFLSYIFNRYALWYCGRIEGNTALLPHPGSP